MDVLSVTALVLHIAFAAIWFGHKLGLPGDARITARTMDGPQEGLIGRLKRAAGMDVLAAAGTFVTGGVLVYRQGIDQVEWTVHAGVGAAVGMILVSVLMTRPVRRQLRDALAAGQRPEATAASRRLATAVNVEGLCWLVALVLMVI